MAAASPPLPRRRLRTQTNKADEAKRVATAELRDCVFPSLNYEVMVKGLADPVFVIDNAPPHEAAAVAMGWGSGEAARWPIAPYSPDQNKVAEHAIGNVKRTLQARAAEERSTLTARRLQALLQEVFASVVTAAGVARDVESLITTLQVIRTPRGQIVRCADGKLHRGTGGDWPPAALR